MGKLLVAVLILVLSYFAFFKRTEPPKEIQANTEQVEQITITHNSAVSSTSHITSSSPVSTTTALVATDSTFGGEGALPDEADGSGELAKEKDEPTENVDQTVIANEKRLAEARSAQEVFELLRKLRIRPKKLNEISTPAISKDYSKFWGSYEGPVLNNRQEVIFNFNIELKEDVSNGQSRIAGGYQMLTPGKPAKGFAFSSNQFGVQLVGRDALVINGLADGSYFQFYKLDNGYLAGNYYEKTSRRTKTYRFVLKNK